MECLLCAREQKSRAFLDGGQQLPVVRIEGEGMEETLTEMPKEQFSLKLFIEFLLCAKRLSLRRKREE